MSHEMRLERLYDATSEEVFDAFVDPAAQERLHGGGQPGWVVHRCESDVRVGGTSTYVMGPEGKEPDTEIRAYSVVDFDRIDWPSATRCTPRSGDARSRRR